MEEQWGQGGTVPSPVGDVRHLVQAVLRQQWRRRPCRIPYRVPGDRRGQSQMAQEAAGPGGGSGQAGGTR